MIGAPLTLLDLVGPSAEQQDFVRDQKLNDLGISTHGAHNRSRTARLRAAVGARLLLRGALVGPVDAREGRLL